MKDNPLLKLKINSEGNYVDTYRISYVEKESNRIHPLSPFDIICTYPTTSNVKNSYYVHSNLQNIVKQINPTLIKVDNTNIFEFNSDDDLLQIYINKALEKEANSKFIISDKANTMNCGLLEVDSCKSLPLIINRNINAIAGTTRIGPGNVAFINPENIEYLSYDKVVFPTITEGYVGTLNGTIFIYSYPEIPKDKIIVSLMDDDPKKNLFQIIDNKIIFMEDDEQSLGNFFDSINLINIVDETKSDTDTTEETINSITLNGITYKLVPM